eukprot:365760-Chlamydomonas_euryale.AAC.5
MARVHQWFATNCHQFVLRQATQSISMSAEESCHRSTAFGISGSGMYNGLALTQNTACNSASIRYSTLYV